MISVLPWWIWLGALLLAVPLDRAVGLEPDPSTSDALPRIDWSSEVSAASTESPTENFLAPPFGSSEGLHSRKIAAAPSGAPYHDSSNHRPHNNG
jgi:hypothetical protein